MQPQPLVAARIPRLLFVVLALALSVSLYWITRYSIWGSDIDTVRVSFAAEGIAAEGQLAPREGAYHAGFGYPGVLAVLSQLAGVNVQSLQIYGGMWLVVVALTAFLCYLQLVERPAVALLAVLLLLLQPDFVFYILRGSHEKMTWTLVLLLLFLLFRSIWSDRRPAVIAATIPLFYLAFWAVTATNAYFASTLITTFAFCCVGGLLLTLWLRKQDVGSMRPLFRRLLITSVACFALVFVFVTFTYAPALGYYSNLDQLVDRLSTLFLGAQPTQRPYAYVGTAWRSPWVYVLLTITQWGIAGCALYVWGRQGLALLRRTREPRAQELVLWLLYTALGVQLACGILADLAGFLSGNLQVRLFVPFALLASPMAASLIWQQLQRLAGWRRRLAAPLAAGVVGLGLVACLLKITNDPLLSNQWQFGTPNELRASEWADTNLRYQSVWIGTAAHEDRASRQFDLLRLAKGYGWTSTNSYVFGDPAQLPKYVLISDVMRLQANRSQLSLPSVVAHHRVYDNGSVQIYARPPQSPYQR